VNTSAPSLISTIFDPLDELLSSLLSHRTKTPIRAALETAQSEISNLARMLEAPVEEIEAQIAPVTWPEQKAPRGQAVLRAIETKPARYRSISYKNEQPRGARLAESLPGVGPKTSAATLSFSRLRMRALPVDSHHHSVAIRLGIIPKSLAVGPSHAVLERCCRAVGRATVYDNHEILMLHGQKSASITRPPATSAVLLDLCPEGQRRMISQPEKAVNLR
jgi:endonuclease-3